MGAFGTELIYRHAGFKASIWLWYNRQTFNISPASQFPQAAPRYALTIKSAFDT